MPQKNSSAPFTEEFDFEAMNEKFKKDEVWGALGKLDKKDIGETEVSSVAQSFGGRASYGLRVKPNTMVGIRLSAVSLISADDVKRNMNFLAWSHQARILSCYLINDLLLLLVPACI